MIGDLVEQESLAEGILGQELSQFSHKTDRIIKFIQKITDLEYIWLVLFNNCN